MHTDRVCFVPVPVPVPVPGITKVTVDGSSWRQKRGVCSHSETPFGQWNGNAHDRTAILIRVNRQAAGQEQLLNGPITSDVSQNPGSLVTGHLREEL